MDSTTAASRPTKPVTVVPASPLGTASRAASRSCVCICGPRPRLKTRTRAMHREDKDAGKDDPAGAGAHGRPGQARTS